MKPGIGSVSSLKANCEKAYGLIVLSNAPFSFRRAQVSTG